MNKVSSMCFKVLLLLFFLLCNCFSMAQGKSKEISLNDADFVKAYKLLSKHLYIYDGKVLDFRQGAKSKPKNSKKHNSHTHNPNKHKLVSTDVAVGGWGVIQGKVKHSTANGVVLSRKGRGIRLVVNNEHLSDGQVVERYVIRIGTFVSSGKHKKISKLPEFAVVAPISKQEFFKYLKSQPNLFVYVKRTPKLEKDSKKCNTCLGRGRVDHPNRNKLANVDCPKCKGSGEIVKTTKPKKPYYEKLRVKL